MVIWKWSPTEELNGSVAPNMLPYSKRGKRDISYFKGCITQCSHWLCLHMCEIKAITTFHLTEDAISLDKTFRSANVSARTHFPVWCPASNRGAIMATRCIYKMSVCMHMSMSKIMCVWVSIFIRGVEENPITTVSVEIKETDLWWLSSRSRGFCVCVWVCVFARLLRGSWQWSRGRKKAERSNKWKRDAGMSQLEINVASDPVWFIPCYTLPFFFFWVWFTRCDASCCFDVWGKTLGIDRKSSHLFSGWTSSWRESTTNSKRGKRQRVEG